MNRKIVTIIGLVLVSPLLVIGRFVYAATSDTWNDGEVTPSILAVSLTGDKEKFEEDRWVSRNVTGGVSDFSALKEDKNGDYVDLEGKGLAGSNDYYFNGTFKREGLGTINFEFKQFRKYYDGTGGFYSRFNPTAASPTAYFNTDRDLFLDIGNLKVEAVISKDDATKCTFSYEREYRQGAKSMITWNSVEPYATANTIIDRKIYPNFLEIDEISDKLDLKLEHTVNGIDVSVEQTWESIANSYRGTIASTFNLTTGQLDPASGHTSSMHQDLDSDIYTTIVRVSKELNEKVFFSIGALNTYYREHTRRTITDTGTDNHPLDPASLGQDTFTLLPKVSISLLKDLLMDAGLRYEYAAKDSHAQYNRVTTPTSTNIVESDNIESIVPEARLGETLNLKYTKFRDATFYADVELEQQWRNLNDTMGGFGNSNSNTFGINSAIETYNYGYTLGSKWYPMPKVDATTEFKYSYGLRRYWNDNNVGATATGYDAYMNSLSYTSYKPMIMVNFRPLTWLACNFRYALDTMMYGVRTPPAPVIERALYIANCYSGGVTLTPRKDLFVTGAYQYKQVSTETQANGAGGAMSGNNQPTYNANVKTLSVACSYSPYKDITFRGSYSISACDNFNDFSATGLPLGLDNYTQDASVGFEKKIGNDCSIGFKYDFMQYAGTSNGGITDYEAHLFYTDLKTKF